MCRKVGDGKLRIEGPQTALFTYLVGMLQNLDFRGLWEVFFPFFFFGMCKMKVYYDVSFLISLGVTSRIYIHFMIVYWLVSILWLIILLYFPTCLQLQRLIYSSEKNSQVYELRAGSLTEN